MQKTQYLPYAGHMTMLKVSGYQGYLDEVQTTKNIITDVLLIFSVFLFVGGMIYEEKEKKLFYITRATVHGRTGGIVAKQSFMPYFAGAAILAVCVMLYNFIPAYSNFNYLKYLNFVGLFAGVLILGIPLILKAMNLDFAQWASVYPVYAMTSFILKKRGIAIVTGYVAVIIAGTFSCFRFSSD